MADTRVPNYYAILGIPQSADLAAIKSTYKRLALAQHPDRRRNEPSATADFQLLLEAYEHLSNVNKRREYDKIYLSTIRPREIKDQKIAELRKQIQELSIKRKTSERLLNNAKKDLVRLFAERDSLKGEKERLKMEKAAKETWWLYIYSFLPGKAAEFKQTSRRQESAIISMIGRQRTKEMSVDFQKEYIQTLEGCIWSISSDEKKNKAEIRKVEEDYIEKMLQQAQERILTELRKKREQAFYARPSTQAYSREEYSHFHGTGAWGF